MEPSLGFYGKIGKRIIPQVNSPTPRLARYLAIQSRPNLIAI
jgi:hypothetical protein